MSEDRVNRKGNRRGMSPGSRRNLAKGQFRKGEVSNPKGRPPNELSITHLTREQLGDPCPKDPSKTWAKYLSDRWLDLASENIQAFKELMERLEGRVTFSIAAESPPDEVVWVIGKGYISREESNKLEVSQPEALSAPAEQKAEPAKPVEETSVSIERRYERESSAHQF